MRTSTQEKSITFPFEPCFSGHETFAFRHGWLKKGFDHLQQDPEFFQRPDALVQLGVGKNMVRSIRHWCIATRIAEELPGTRGRSLRPTSFGQRCFGDDGWDPYLEDDATLWVLHWHLAGPGTRVGTWYWAFNSFREHSFTRAGLTQAWTQAVGAHGFDDVSEHTLSRDVECCLHMYAMPRRNAGLLGEHIECPLTALDLIAWEPTEDRLRFQQGPKPSLPGAVFAYSLVQFWEHHCPEREALEVRELLGTEGTPVHVFKLDEDSVLGHLDALTAATEGALEFQDTAQVRRILRQRGDRRSPLDYLEAYYAR